MLSCISMDMGLSMLVNRSQKQSAHHNKKPPWMEYRSFEVSSAPHPIKVDGVYNRFCDVSGRTCCHRTSSLALNFNRVWMFLS